MSIAGVLRSVRGGSLALVVFAAAAAGTCGDFLNALAQRESSMNAQAQNRYGYVGLFQMGEAALVDAGYYRADGTGKNDWAGSWTGFNGINSLADFKANPQAQAQAVTAYHQRLWRYIRSMGLDTYIGKTINGIQMTQSGLIAAAHLVGSGNLATFLRSNGQLVPRDGNRTPLTEYISRFGGYSIMGSGADCTSFLSGRPTAGVPVASPAVALPASPGPAPAVRTVAHGPLSGDVDPYEAYYATTGHSADHVAGTIKLIAAVVLILVAAGCWLGGWQLFTAGTSTWHQFLRGNQRLLVVMLVFLWVLS